MYYLLIRVHKLQSSSPSLRTSVEYRRVILIPVSLHLISFNLIFCVNKTSANIRSA